MSVTMGRDIFGPNGSLNLTQFSNAQRDALLKDDSLLEDACHEIYNSCCNTFGNVELRTAGRIISDVHRQLSLQTPTDADLCRTLMSYTTGTRFSLCQRDFIDLLRQVLRKNSEENFPDEVLANPQDEHAQTVDLLPNGEIRVLVCTVSGSCASFTVNDRDLVQVLQSLIEEALNIPVSVQQLVLGASMLQNNTPMYLQGVADNSIITVVRAKPQATILRIRKAHLGDTSIPQKIPSTAADVPKSGVTRLDSLTGAKLSKGMKFRQKLPDVKLRKCNLGRL